MAGKVPRLERGLGRLAKVQCRYYIPIIILSLLITAIVALGLPNVRIQSDLTEILPQDLPVIVYQNRISETFGGTDTIFVLVKIDDDCISNNCVKDIRDPGVVRMLKAIEVVLPGKSGVTSVFSPASLFPDQNSIPPTLEGVKLVFSQFPQLEESFNRDYSATLVIISSSVGGEQEKINRFTEAIEDELEDVEMPPGIELSVTGVPQLTADIFTLLQEDAVNVTVIAGVIILVLLLILIRNLLRVFQTYTPVLFSLIWTFGLLGWLDIALSVATAAIGAFIIGLGIEYGIFWVKRFEECRGEGGSIEKSVQTAVAGIGSAITSSATTTIIGFMALTMTVLPLIQILGITVALSILFSLLATLLVSPAFILAEEKLIERFKRRRTENEQGS
jgi:hydrophobe/amphiphile efflux-3 (HAE3) family protein